MTTYYIDPTFGSGGDGSEATPWNTWGSVTPWSAGNTYLQKRGTTHQGTIPAGASGTSTGRITIGAYGTGNMPIVQGASAEHGVNLGTRSYITIENIHAIAGPGSLRNGINGLATDATTNHYITIDNCVAESPTSTGGIGIALRGVGDIISNTEVKNCTEDGMFLTVSNCLVDSCLIKNFDTSGGSNGDGIQFAGTHDYGKTTLRNTKIFGQIKNPIKQCVITAAGSGTFRVEGGEFYGMVTGLSLAIPNSVISNAKVWGGTARGITCAANGVVVKSCLIYNTPMGIVLDTVTGVTITNCTIDASEQGISASNGAATYTAKNCWISGTLQAHLLSSTATATVSSNRYPTNSVFRINATSYDLAGWKTATSSDADSSEIAPSFALDYRPKNTSLLVETGTFVSYDEDVDGIQFNNPPSIGAYEYIPSRGTR